MRHALLAIAAVLALSGTAIAHASPDNDTAFLADVGMWGYSGPWQRTVATAHAICDMLDEGSTEQMRTDLIVAAFGANGPSQGREYKASMFTLLASNYYCPEHMGEVSGF